MPTIVHFEIPTDDIERAKKFYTALFGRAQEEELKRRSSRGGAQEGHFPYFAVGSRKYGKCPHPAPVIGRPISDYN